MTQHWWQHWFWITAATPALLLVLTMLESANASSPWEEPTLWTSTAWFPAAPSPVSWAVQRRLLGFAVPQAAIPVAGLPPLAPAPATVQVNPGVRLEVASSTPTAVTTPTVEAVIFTLSPPHPVADVLQPSVQSVADAQNKSSQSVNTASQKTPPAKATRPKTLKTTAVAAPKSSMVRPIASKLPPKTTTTTTTTSTTPTSTTPPPTTILPPILPPDSVQDMTSPAAKGPSEQSVEQVMNDSPADVPAASAVPTTGTSAVPVNSSSVPSPPAPASAAKVFASTSTTTLAPVKEAPIRAESTSDLGIVHPGVSFDNASGLHRSSIDSHSGLNAASITGIALGVMLFAVLVGSVSFVLYRRRYLNKPQTLNDKCSNPDSSGYIDDSTLRENSEEMYSLDNDSFLNSLEAMTIQNYWTDSVKHTKL